MQKRNSIAHGEQSYADATTDCMPWNEKTMKFIDSLKDSLIESARNKLSKEFH